MKKSKKARLQGAGWQVGTAADFLGLSQAEVALIEMKLSLGQLLRKHRQKARQTQAELAMAIGSSQSRVAKMEAGDPSVSMDLLIRGLLATGTSLRVVGRVIGSRVA